MTPLQLQDIARLAAGFATSLPGMFKRPYWRVEQIQDYQLALMKKRLEEARLKVPLYRERHLPEASQIQTLADWRRLPLVTKQDLLREGPEHRLNPDFPLDSLIVSKSSGSTGQALDVYYDREAFYQFILAGFRLYRMAFRYLPWYRQTYIYTSPYPLNSLFGAYPMEFISTLTPIPETLRRLREYPPHLLVCYPSHLRALVDQMTEEDFRRIRPLAINVNSEMSSPRERKFLGGKLGAFVFDDYSSEELTRIASQCRELNYHLFDDINYIEVVDEQGDPVPDGIVGNLVGTNLLNRAMPLLRYAQGDRGAVRASTCGCGRRFRILEKLEGRKNDAFLLPNGQTLSSGYLLDLTYGIFLNYPQAVQAFCLVQEKPASWYLEIVPGSQWTPDLGTRLISDLKNSLQQPSVTITLKEVREVTRTASGKANPIISRVKKA